MGFWKYRFVFCSFSWNKNRFFQKGINPDSIKVTGVPVDKRFQIESKELCCDKYRLLLLGGGRGLFDIDEDFMHWIDEFIEEHSNSIEITIVTGKNKNYMTI